MADTEFSGIDQLLSESLKRVAEPGDPAGVADLIRARVDGGDTGTPSTGGEFSGGPGSGWPWLPWVGGAVVAAVVGGAVGATGVFGSLQASEPAPGTVAAPTVSVSHVANGLDCPGGSAVVTFRPGERVLAVARSDDSAYLAVRSPFDRADTVWLPVSVVEVDAGQSPLASLPVDGCAEPTITLLPPPSPEPSEPPAPPTTLPTTPPTPPPTTPPTQPPAPDTTPPTLGTPSGVQALGCGTGFGGKPGQTTISVSASDNKGVVGVLISWNGVDSGSAQMSKSGGNWTYLYDTPDSAYGDVVFTMVARDAAGNQSAAKHFTVNVTCLG